MTDWLFVGFDCYLIGWWHSVLRILGWYVLVVVAFVYLGYVG